MSVDLPQEDDASFEEHGVRIVIDPRSIQFLDGCQVDFVEDVMGNGFKIENPNAASSCGCGSSFQPKAESGAPPPPESGGCGTCH